MATAILDIGKTHAKLVVLDRDGTERHAVKRATPMRADPPYPHIDADALWGWIVDALRSAPERDAIDAIVPVAHGATAAVMAGDQLALPILDYEHPAPDALAEEYGTLADPFAATFSPRLPSGLNVGRQLFWQARCFAEGFAGATDILMYAQYWAWRLSGRKVSEVTSLGCHTDLWRPREGRFSALVARAGWTGLFPPLQPAWSTLGPVAPAVAAATGLSPDCRVLAGIHDSNASYLAYLAGFDAPFAVVSSGTWVICMAAGGDLDRLDAAHDMLANVDITGAPVPTARFMGGREYHTLCGDAPASAGIDNLAAVLAKGTLALPSFVAGTGPFPQTAGRVVGPVVEGPAERAALAALYLALMLDEVLARLGAAGAVFIDGPFAHNALITDTLATLRPHQAVYAMPSTSGAAHGARRLITWPDRQRPKTDVPSARTPLRDLTQALGAARRTWRAALNDETA